MKGESWTAKAKHGTLRDEKDGRQTNSHKCKLALQLLPDCLPAQLTPTVSVEEVWRSGPICSLTATGLEGGVVALIPFPQVLLQPGLERGH